VKRALTIGLSIVLAISTASAQAPLPERRVGVRFVGSVPHVTFHVRDLVDDGVRRALSSGLTKTITVTVQTYSTRRTDPLASRELTCRITYDLWEQAFVVRRGRRTESVSGLDAAIDRCVVATDLPVATLQEIGAYRGQAIYFAVRAEFDPIARSRCPRLLRNPAGDDPLGPVVVNIVRRQICQAQRSVEFRTPTVYVP
jgi:hypothetical protein